VADFRFARQPRWIAGHLLVVVLATLFVNLGLWQLRRLDDRQATNAAVEARAAVAPEPVEALADPSTAGDDLDDLRFRRATATGTYVRGADVAVRATQDGRTGGRVFSVLELASGGAVVVLRGFVSPSVDGALVAPPPPEAEVEVEGLLVPRERLEGVFEQGVDELAGDRPDVLPVVLQAATADAEDLAAVPPPDLGDGPHLAYAVQWFLFAAVGLVGYPLLLRHRAQEAPEDVDAA
jgi:cytochrome oxidase assembly protein ShyY1